MSIVVHHLEASRSFRVLWLLEELGLDYTLTAYARDPATMRAPAALKQVFPLGRAPVVAVDGHVLAESGAILEYFVEREGQLGPDTADEKREYRFFMHYAEGSVMPPLLVKLITGKLRTGVPFFLKPLTSAVANQIDGSYTDPEIANHFGFVEQVLGERSHFAGERFTAADIQMLYAVNAGLSRGAAGRPHCQAWLERMQARPAYARAVEKGGADLTPR